MFRSNFVKINYFCIRIIFQCAFCMLRIICSVIADLNLILSHISVCSCLTRHISKSVNRHWFFHFKIDPMGHSCDIPLWMPDCVCVSIQRFIRRRSVILMRGCCRRKFCIIYIVDISFFNQCQTCQSICQHFLITVYRTLHFFRQSGTNLRKHVLKPCRRFFCKRRKIRRDCLLERFNSAVVRFFVIAVV